MSNFSSGFHILAHKTMEKGAHEGPVGAIVGGAAAGITSAALLPFLPPHIHIAAAGIGASIGGGIEKAIKKSVSLKKRPKHNR